MLSDLVLACKGLGVLRRIMLKYKANMGPEQVANTLLCLQHLTLEGRRLRGASPASQRGGSSSSSQHHADEELAQAAAQRRGASVARAQPRVRAAQEFSRATARAAESDGPQEQLVAQMLGELGNMIWHMMGDMSGACRARAACRICAACVMHVLLRVHVVAFVERCHANACVHIALADEGQQDTTARLGRSGSSLPYMHVQ